MSEDEADLVGNIIKVVISRKSQSGEVEICHTAGSSRKRSLLPKIVVTDYSEYDITDLFQEAEEEYLSSQYSHSQREETDSTAHLDIGTEFQSEPRDLLPDSYLSYMGSCQSLIGHISQYSELRVSAEDWIEQFDKEIDDAIKLAEAEEEKERQERRREEERRLRLERRKLIRKINQPLLNKAPHQGGGRHHQSSHNRVCQLPLITLKRMLRRYQPKFGSRFSKNNRQQESFFDHISTSEAIELLRSEFAKYLSNQRDLVLGKGPLNLEGKCFETLKIPEKIKKEGNTPRQDVNIVESYNITELTEVITVSRKETFRKISFQELLKEERLKLRPNFSKSKRVREKEMRSEYDVFNPNSRKNKRIFQSFGKTVNTSKGSKFPWKKNEKNEIIKGKPIKNILRNITRTPIKNKAVVHIFIPKLENYDFLIKKKTLQRRIKNVNTYNSISILIYINRKV